VYTKHNYTVTVAEARNWLDTKRGRNRPISENAVAKYAQEMAAERWVDTAEGLIFGVSGRLLDGQHRLTACVRVNKPFVTSITWGVPDEYFDRINDSNSRSLADVLHIKGETGSVLLSAGLRFLWIYSRGEIERRDLRKGQIATKPLLEATLDKHPKIRQSVKFYSMIKSRPGGLLIPAGMAIGLHYLFSLVDEKKADEFFTRLQSGLELTEDNPIYILRNRLIAGQKEASTKLTPPAMYYYTVVSWNAYVSGTYVKRLIFAAETVPPEIDNLPKKMMKDLL
jgi:hypothetical protein